MISFCLGISRRRGYADGFRRIEEFEELTNLAAAELVKISLRCFESSACFFMPERARSQSYDAVALRNVFVDLVRNHLPIVAESGEVTFHFLFGVGRAGEFHGFGAVGEGTKFYIVSHQGQPIRDAAALGIVPLSIGFL